MSDAPLTRDELNAIDRPHANGVAIGESPLKCPTCQTPWPCDTHRWVEARIKELTEVEGQPGPLDGEDG